MLRAIGRAMRQGHIPVGEFFVGLALLAALTFGWFLVWPYVLPVRIFEGPLVQDLRPDGFKLIWYTTRAADCRPVFTDATATTEHDGTRAVATVRGLAPGQVYRYEIRCGDWAIPEGAGAVRTTRPATESFTFVAFGDSGRGKREQYLLAQRIRELQPDFIVHTGDVVYGGGERENYPGRFFAPYRHLLREIPLWPSIGNHDEHDLSAYLEVFELPENGPAGVPAERNYWFDYGAARFVVIDSMLTQEVLAERVAPWIAEVFEQAPAPRWRFAVFHHPPYTHGNYAGEVRTREALAPALEAADVDVVFNGHDHLFERTAPLRGGAPDGAGRGVVYVVTGAGGASLYPWKSAGDERIFAAENNATYSFTRVRIDGLKLELQQIGLDGEVLDRWEYEQAAEAATEAPAGG